MKAPTRKDSGKKLLAGDQTKLLTGCHEKQPNNLHEPAHLSIEEIHRRAEIMTPLLKGILDFRPLPRWDR